MLVFEYMQKIRLKEDVHYEKAAHHIAYYIDSMLGKDENFLKFHKEKIYKHYVFDLFYPFEKTKIYKAGEIYTFKIRTISQELADYFSNKLNYHKCKEFEGIGGEIKIVQKRVLDKVYSITPILLKQEQGYWKDNMTLEQFEERIKINLIKKYKIFNKLEDENIQLYNFMEFKNSKPVRIYYKGKILLGDKLQFEVCKNEIVQDLWYMALGTGIGENNARGAGFLGYRYL